MHLKNPFNQAFARASLAALVVAFAAASGNASLILFTEDFELPDVNAAQSTGTTNKTTPSSWVRHGGAFGADRHGIVDKAAGAFFAADPNHQAYAFRYTASPGITSAPGVIGAIEAGRTYRVSFDVQQDLADVNGSGANGDYYSAQLVAYGAGADRAAHGSINGTLLASVFGNVPADGQFHTVSFLWQATNPAVFGQDLAVRFKDVWASGNSRSSGVIDNVLVVQIPEPSSIAIWSLLGLGLVGYGVRRRGRK